jgi:flagellar hook-associated protein 3 FlgL
MMLRRQSAGLKESLTRLTTELTTGERVALGGHVNGGFDPLAGLERSIRRLDGFSQVRANLEVRTSGIQTSLAAVDDVISTFGIDLAAAASLEQADVLDAKLASASGRLNQVVSILNTEVSGQFLFSGTSSDAKPLLDGEAIMSHIRGLATSATSAADFVAQVDSWFHDSGAGFEVLAYAGGDTSLSHIAISNSLTIDLPIKADDDAFRTALQNLAIATAVSEGAIAMSDDEKRHVLSQAGQGLMSSSQALIGMQRDTGSTEGMLAGANVSDNIERNVLELARSKITSADPYETASALEAVQLQIEALYILTARTSQLRLSDYL